MTSGFEGIECSVIHHLYVLLCRNGKWAFFYLQNSGEKGTKIKHYTEHVCMTTSQTADPAIDLSIWTLSVYSRNFWSTDFVPKESQIWRWQLESVWVHWLPLPGQRPSQCWTQWGCLRSWLRLWKGTSGKHQDPSPPPRAPSTMQR